MDKLSIQNIYSFPKEDIYFHKNSSVIALKVEDTEDFLKKVEKLCPSIEVVRDITGNMETVELETNDKIQSAEIGDFIVKESDRLFFMTPLDFNSIYEVN